MPNFKEKYTCLEVGKINPVLKAKGMVKCIYGPGK